MGRVVCHVVHHFGQGLLHGQRLPQLADLPLRRSAHEQLDLQRSGDHRLQAGQAAVFPQVFQGLQHKHGLHLIDELFHLPHHVLEGRTALGQLPDLQGHQHLAGGGGAGVEHIDVLVGVILLHQHPGLFGAVVGAAEQGGQGDHIHVLLLRALIGIQIALGGGTGSGGGLLALLHGPQQIGLVKGLVVNKAAPVGADGQRHLYEAWVLQHLAGQIAAAVHRS